MRYLTVEQILFIHDYVINKFGGTDGILSLSMLEAAVYRPQTSFGGEEKFRTLAYKAAVLTYTIIKNHPFVDGNKRTAIVASLLFIELNGSSLNVDNAKIEKMAREVADGSMSLEMLRDHFTRYILP